MRLIELKIENVRGIKELELKLDGKSFGIWGPNGSGKSAVVDAIDFLFTGGISRLAGKGTGGITLRRHGPHIDQEPTDAKVSATFRIPGLDHEVELTRLMSKPQELESSDGSRQLENLLSLAGRRQYVLTRREILKFITAEAATRAEQFTQLLHLDDVAVTRRTLVTTLN